MSRAGAFLFSALLFVAGGTVSDRPDTTPRADIRAAVPSYQISITRANGAVLDLTLGSRVEMAGLGTLSEETEVTLLDLAHGDVTLTLHDQDGTVEAFLDGITPTEIVTVAIDRSILGSRTKKWERVFAGVPQLPWSLSFNRKDKTVTLQVFSYSKVLESAAADGLVRTVGNLFTGLGTGTVTAGTNVITTNSTQNVVSGDLIRLSDGTNTEEQTVLYTSENDSALPALRIYTVENWTNAFAGAAAEITTPFNRWVSAPRLAQLAVALAPSLHVGNLSLTRVISPVPFLSPLSGAGLPVRTANGWMVEKGADSFAVGFNGGGGGINDGDRFNAGNPGTLTWPETSWVKTNPPVAGAQGDWTPYLLTRPSNFPLNGPGDQGFTAWDHTNNRYYTLVVTIVVNTSTLNLFRGGVFLKIIDTYVSAGEGYSSKTLDYEPTLDQVWVSYSRANGAQARIDVYDVVATTVAAVAGSTSGQLRYCRALTGAGKGTMFHLDTAGTTMRLYDPASKGIYRFLIGNPAIPKGTDLWTLRDFDGFVVVAYRVFGRVRLRVWDEGFNVEADYDVANAAPIGALQTVPIAAVWNHSIYGQFYVIWNNAAIGTTFDSEWYVLSRRYAGVIPYADTSGLSAGSVVRDIALMSLSVVSVDPFANVSVIERDPSKINPFVIGDGVVIERRDLPVWEFYRGKVTVTGRTLAGDDFEESAGSDPSRELDLDSGFIATPSLALAVAGAYLSFLGQPRKQIEMRLDVRDGPLLHPLQAVQLDGRVWVVLKSTSDLAQLTQELTLAEVP